MIRATRSLSARLAWVLGCVVWCLTVPAASAQVAGGEVTAKPAPSQAPPYGAFAVRGRLGDPWAVTWRADPEGGPASAAQLEAALERAMASWAASGLVAFRQAREGEPATVRFGWRRGAHEACRPFGQDPAAAHTGPMGISTFVHFDAGRSWRVDDGAHAGAAEGPSHGRGDGRGDGGGDDGGDGSRDGAGADVRDGVIPDAGDAPRVESLAAAAAHELGHVLGLDHSADSGALMSPDPTARAPQAPDLQGLRSLYGRAPAAGADDLAVLRGAPGAGPAMPISPGLRGVAPLGRSAATVFDTDGDGDDEVLVWRTDERGLGALMIYHFERSPWSGASAGSGAARSAGWPGPALARSVGPLLGAVPPEARNSFRRDMGGGRWLLSEFADGYTRLRRFGQDGLLHMPTPAQELALELHPLPLAKVVLKGADAEAAVGDLDADGVDEAVVRVVPPGDG